MYTIGCVPTHALAQHSQCIMYMYYILVDIILGALESDSISNLLDTENANTSVLPPPKDHGKNLIITSY